MNTLTKKVIEFLTAFVSRVFVDNSEGKFSKYGEKALAELQRVFLEFGLTLSSRKRETKSKQEGRTTSHNKKERFYVLVERENCSCPLVCKPVYTGSKAEKELLTWVVIPDSDCVQTQSELESYLSCFLPDVVGKSKNELSVRIYADAARQIGEDVTNNTRQRGAKALSDAIAQSRVLTALCAPYLLMPDDMFNVAKQTILSMPPIEGIDSKTLLAYIENQRAEAEAEQEADSN